MESDSCARAREPVVLSLSGPGERVMERTQSEMQRDASALLSASPSVSIARRGADLVLTTRLGLAAAPEVRELVVRDRRQAHVYRARPLHLVRLQSLIGVKYPVHLAFDPTPPLGLTPHTPGTPRPYQDAALAAWEGADRRGVVVLPTGAGKTLVAALAIARAGTRALVLVPTIDLCHQMRQEFIAALGVPEEAVGIMCAGDREWDRPIVVSTYDSAAATLGRVSDFGLLVADEVHHLPAPGYRAIAEAATAPYRLGLSATLARSDGREVDLDELIGPVVSTERPETLSAEGYLAPYQVVTLRVDLSPEERAAYERDMALYLDYRDQAGGTGMDAGAFLMEVRKKSVFDRDARAAMLAYQRARTLALTSQAKTALLETLLIRHRSERCLVFAEHVEAVEAVGRAYLLPTITGRTPAAERAALTADFAEGRVTKIAVSRVWNEGVNVPAASVAIMMAGTGMERDAIQRLGRILRPAPGKQAVLYELVARQTAEEGISARRGLRRTAARDHGQGASRAAVRPAARGAPGHTG